MRGVSSVDRRKASTGDPVEDYLASVPEPAQSTLRKVRAAIRSVVPADATEAISYGIPSFRHNGALVAYAAFKDHCSFFPMNAGLIKSFQKELANYSQSKGTIRFPSDQPLPAALIKKLVKIRVTENASKKRRSSKTS